MGYIGAITNLLTIDPNLLEHPSRSLFVYIYIYIHMFVDFSTCCWESIQKSKTFKVQSINQKTHADISSLPIVANRIPTRSFAVTLLWPPLRIFVLFLWGSAPISNPTAIFHVFSAIVDEQKSDSKPWLVIDYIGDYTAHFYRDYDNPL